MPFWAAVLRGRVVYLLVARHPFEVSDSLASRNGCTPLLSMAMWERYTRQAMLGSAGSPAIACTYDGVLSDPVGWCEQLAVFLGEVGIATRGVDRRAVEAFVMSDLRHSSRSWAELEPGPQISAEQVELARAASVSTAQQSYALAAAPRRDAADDGALQGNDRAEAEAARPQSAARPPGHPKGLVDGRPR